MSNFEAEKDVQKGGPRFFYKKIEITYVSFI